ncbi:GNAT family N-acetyltransferase [Sedimentitalea todarodis]|uniref:GNAT family N-acetyltransferase n=1 Tax=Sedimentitalea todarodis TaxID=1631240 RepID=A0ABU3V8B5_9RHOB|nr:GNAT family N-acetyltransferase [Sedimentitalea todarodis]MDU9002426.1 GNAT family N-acetyltransferase [Sedimentitalea todarodis]
MTVVLRAATPLDAGATGNILWQSLRRAPNAEVFSAAEAIGYCGVMIERNWVTVAMSGTGVQGFLARDGQEICALYTAATARGQAIGRRLVEKAKCEVSRLHLQTSGANTRARRFYARAGFVPVPPAHRARPDATQPAWTYVWQKEIAA